MADRTDQTDSGLAVRLLRGDGGTAGVGVLVGPREILTCAHLVNIALGLDRRAQDQPADEVSVQFGGGDGPVLRAWVQRWMPPPRTGAIGDDIAGLVLTGTELPTGATPALLAANPPRRGQVVDVFGYPGNPPRPHGAWVSATVRGQLPGGGHLQLDCTLDSALRIQPGFSGSPVYDSTTNRVLGGSPDTKIRAGCDWARCTTTRCAERSPTTRTCVMPTISTGSSASPGW